MKRQAKLVSMRDTESSYVITRVILNAPRKPVDQITDRAKRYRAQQDVQGPREQNESNTLGGLLKSRAATANPFPFNRYR